MRILHVITLGELGGAQRYLAELAVRQRDCGFTVDLACGSPSWLSAQPGFDRVHEIRSLARPISPGRDVVALLTLRQIIGREKYDVVHTHSSKAGLLGRLAAATCGTSVIAHTSHGTALAEALSPPRRAAYWFAEQLGATLTRRLFVVSETEGRLLKRVLRVRKNAVRVMSIVPENARSLREHWQDSNETRLELVSVGNLYPNKGYRFLLEAVAQLRSRYPSVRLTIYGDGPERSTLEGIRDQLGLDGHVAMPGPSADLSGAFARSGIFVLSSIKEGLPLVLLEAMAAGIPIVATDVGAIAEVLGEGCDLARPRDPKGLADRIARLLESDEARARSVTATRRAFERMLLRDSRAAVCTMYA